MEGKSCTFKLQNITITEMKKVVSSMKSNNSTDLISIRTIKKLYKALEPSLINLVNLVISTTNYPKLLKKKVQNTVHARLKPTHPSGSGALKF